MQAEAANASEELLPEVRALGPEEICRITADVRFAVGIALGG